MIEIIPNPLTDEGVKQDIRRKVEELMNRPVRNALYSHDTISDYMQKMVKQAAEWGMLEGFRMGWMVRENRKSET